MGHAQQTEFICEFCLSPFKSTLKSVSRTSSITCGKCRSLAAAWTLTKAVGDKHQFYTDRRRPIKSAVDDDATKAEYGYSALDLGSNSVKKVVAKCDFCRSMFHTSLCIVNRKPVTACKRCDATASHYAKSKSTEDPHEYWKSHRPKLDFLDVNTEATMSKFGYSPLELNLFTTKKIVAVCAYCKTDVVLAMSKYAQRAGNVACPKCIRRKTVKTLQTKYGVSTTLDIPSVQLKLANPKTEQIVETVLTGVYQVPFQRNVEIGPYSFDFYIPSCDLLIECQGDYFHDFKKNGYAGTPQDRAKSSYIESHTSHKLIWLWEHELHMGRIRKVLDFHIGKVLEPPLRVDLHRLTFQSVSNSDAHSFLAQFHYLGNLGTVASCFGAFDGGTLAAVCAFGGVTRQQSIQKVNRCVGTNLGPKQLRELRRFCIRPNVSAKNMASYCLKRFLDLCKAAFPNVDAVLSFSDPTVGDIGTIYKASNWRQLPDAVKSYYYTDPKTGKRVHKKTVWDMARSAHMTEYQFAANTGLLKAEELPKQVWLKIM
jgi:very-short-patch-repair endonuclease